MEDISNKAWIFRPEDIIELSTEDEKTVIKLSRDDERTEDTDAATKHLDYIGSGRRDKDEEDRLRDVWTHKSVAELRRNEEERGK